MDVQDVPTQQVRSMAEHPPETSPPSTALDDLERRLERLESQVRELQEENETLAEALTRPGAPVGSLGQDSTSSDSSGGPPSSEAMAAVNRALEESLASSRTPTLPGPVSAPPTTAPGSPPAPTVNLAAVERLVAAAVDRAQKANQNPAATSQLIAEEVRRALASEELEQRIQQTLEHELSPEQLQARLGETFSSMLASEEVASQLSQKLLGGRAPDEVAREATREALDKLLDGEGRTGFLEKAISRVIEDKNPEEIVAKRVNELFDKFTRR